MLLEELVLALGGFLGGVPVGGGVLGRERACLVGLEFDGIGAAFRGLADKALGELHAALVVDAGFGDDVRHDQPAVQSGRVEERKDVLHMRAGQPPGTRSREARRPSSMIFSIENGEMARRLPQCGNGACGQIF